MARFLKLAATITPVFVLCAVTSRGAEQVGLAAPDSKQGQKHLTPWGGEATPKEHLPPTKASLKEGIYSYQGPRNILGQGLDRVVTLRKEQSQWFIFYRSIQHFSVNAHKPPEETVAGPFVVTVAGPILEYQGPNGVEKFSYRFDGTALIMPALVRLDDHTWICQTTETLRDPSSKHLVTCPVKYVWRCRADPTKIHQGEAEFPPFGSVAGASREQYTYVFSQEKDSASRTISVLRFLNASKDNKNATESCRLTWDAEGAIQFDARSEPRIHQLKYSKDDRSGRTQPPATTAAAKDPEDFRWLLERATDRDGLDPYYKAILEKLKKSKVPNGDKAKAVALDHKSPLDARETWKIVGLLRIGINIPDFADGGDLIWVVRFEMISWGVTQEMWISSTTGAVRTMLPIQRKRK